MEQRIEILERDVVAIKSEIAVIKSTCWTREDARLFDARLERVEAAIAVLQCDVKQLKADVGQLKADVAQLKVELAQIRVELEKSGPIWRTWSLTLGEPIVPGHV